MPKPLALLSYILYNDWLYVLNYKSMQITLENLRKRIKVLLMQDHNMLLLAAVIGFLAGLASTLFRWLIGFFGVVFSPEG
ncbi:MAG: hypothetical protein HN917_15985, partial [Nitrospina sp.]|nr:hypothetical protein [Nitrospina sp.]